MSATLPRLVMGAVLGCYTIAATAQIVGDNIVPNPGFEELHTTPIGWFYKGDHYTKAMKYWRSATRASPDIYGPGIRVPILWTSKGFGSDRARTGAYMTGITVYGCKDGKPHCREYIQIRLTEALVVGQRYHVEFWVKHLPRSLCVDRMGAYFSRMPLDITTDGLISFKPQVHASRPLVTTPATWTRVSGQFVAERASEFITLGNFSSDSLTTTQAPRDALPFGYYYIDDVSVRKMLPILEVPIPDDDLSVRTFSTGDKIRLRDIYFESDKAELLPRSFVELRKLADVMRRYPDMTIQLEGHTDSEGSASYNLRLSRARAEAVAQWLARHGIPPSRVLYQGYGESRPVDSNQTEAGRAMNRRVEFVVMGM